MDHQSNGGLITYAVEEWDEVKHEAPPLLLRHWEEIAADKEEIPLVIDYAFYDALAAAGVFHIVTVRDAGVLIGYYAAVIRTHPHYATTTFAFTDIFYLAPEYRKSGIGVELFRVLEKTVIARGVKKVFSATKPWYDVGPLLERLGYTKHETVYSKMVG